MLSGALFSFLSIYASLAKIRAISASPAQQKASDDPFANFGDELSSDFEEMDRKDRLHDNIDAGLEKWEDRCLKVGGQEALDRWLRSQEELVYCVMQNFDVTQIKNEIETKKQTGDLDLVFKKYCG